tara:strand:+ start:2151 stop:2585 length:435 start_codon:yes stop_codon:yes gene_type:complete
MAVSYSNNWKNILTALMSKIKAEMKCPVFSDFNATSKANQFIRLVPRGSTLVDLATFIEVREFDIGVQYFFLNRQNKEFQNYVLNQVSILEALIHDNIKLTLADSTEFVNVSFDDLELNVEIDEYEDYFVAEWTLTGTHFGNAA